MNKKEKQLYNFCNELITIFTEYATILESYFKIQSNKKEHEFLYDEFQELGRQLRSLEERYKKWIF